MYKTHIKRISDVSLALIALPLWLIIFLLVAPIIYLQDKGPIFYNAPRLGKDGRIFNMYKFRSMRTNVPDLRNTDGSTYNAVDDSRVTSIGKFIRKTSIDESPQIFNIIKGDMSILGPRPDLPEHFNLYKGNEKRKLEIRPGMSGYNQAFFRNTLPWKERIQKDIYYIDNITLKLDLKIFLKTAMSVLKRENVFVEKKEQS